MKRGPWIVIGLVIAEATSVHTSIKQARAQSNGSWYYCDPAHAYYPYVSTCPVPWREVVPNSNAGSQQPGTTGHADQKSWKAWLIRYWETTGVGGIFMALGALVLTLGVGSQMTTPTRIETRSGGPGVVLRTKYPGHTPTKSDVRHGWKLILWGVITTLFGACITYGLTAVYNTLNALFSKTIG